jgi:hypothetical protein
MTEDDILFHRRWTSLPPSRCQPAPAIRGIPTQSWRALEAEWSETVAIGAPPSGRRRVPEVMTNHTIPFNMVNVPQILALGNFKQDLDPKISNIGSEFAGNHASFGFAATAVLILVFWLSAMEQAG